MFHCVLGSITSSVALLSYQCHYHAIEIEEEHDEVEAKLDERLLPQSSEQMVNRDVARNRPSCAH